MGKSRKSAQGLSLNTVIIGAIVLIVLMVLVGIFSGFFGSRFTPQFAAATEKECKGLGYKTMPSECGIDRDFNYGQVYAKFKEGSVPEGEVCCESSCEARNGICLDGKICLSGKEILSGKSGCVSGKVCCTKP